MIGETLPKNPQHTESDDVELGAPAERLQKGHFADVDERGDEEKIDLQTILEQVEHPRDPNAPVDVPREREHVGKKLEEVTELIDKENEKESALKTARAGLSLTHDNGETLKNLEKAKEKLEADERNIELAAEYNDVLESFGDSSKYSREDIQSIAETGKTKKGKSLRDKYGKELHSDLAKELGQVYKNGGRQVTWGDLLKLGKVVDRILHDAVSVVKGIFKGVGGGGEGESRGTSDASEEQSFAA